MSGDPQGPVSGDPQATLSGDPQAPVSGDPQASVKRLGVVGWPAAHSLSPLIQNAALRDAGMGADWRYQLLPMPPELFGETVRALSAVGFRGVNVTIPHKRAALALADAAGESARGSGAANTLLFEPDGLIQAENSDAPALIAALSARTEIRGSSVVVLGAGGSARTAVWALSQAGAREIAVWNRTPARARELADACGARALAGAPPRQGEVLINCTAAGLDGGDQLAQLGLSAQALTGWGVVVDYVYRPGGTDLANGARAAAVPCVDGLELLVGQGAISFELFTGRSGRDAGRAMRAALAISSVP